MGNLAEAAGGFVLAIGMGVWRNLQKERDESSASVSATGGRVGGRWDVRQTTFPCLPRMSVFGGTPLRMRKENLTYFKHAAVICKLASLVDVAREKPVVSASPASRRRRRIGAKESHYVCHDLPADFAHFILGGAFADLVFLHGDVVVQADERSVMCIAILHAHDPIKRLIGPRQIVGPNVQHESGRRGRTPKIARQL